jgi:hypothetical protein
MSIASRVKALWDDYDYVRDTELELKMQHEEDVLNILNSVLRLEEPYTTETEFLNHNSVDPIGAGIRLLKFGIKKGCCK